MKRVLLTAFLCLGLSGCASVASGVVQIAQSVSSSTPSQVTTLGDAVAASTLVTQAVDVYVKTGNPSKATLLELQTLNEGLHTALTGLEQANASNQSLELAAFNEALTAFTSYTTAKGITH